MTDASKGPASSPEATPPAGDGLPRLGWHSDTSSPVFAAGSPSKTIANANHLPHGLVAFLATAPSEASAAALGLSIKRVEQLRRGDRPRISPAAMRRWEAHVAHQHPLAGRWVLRRVRNSAVQLKGQRYEVPARLAGNGQQLAVVLTGSGALLMQPLAISAACFVVHPTAS